MTQRLTLDQYIDKCNQIHNNQFDYSLVNYQGQSKPVNIICNKHGVFSPLAGNHLRGSGCPLCANESRNDSVRLTTDTFNLKLEERNKLYSPVKLVGEYVNMKTKISVSCTDGHTWSARPQDILNGHGCSICSHLNRSLYPTQAHISDSVLSSLRDRDWLYDQHHVKQKTMQQIAFDTGVTPKCISTYMTKHSIQPLKFGNSQFERDLLEFLNTLTDNILSNDRTIISPLEVDLYLPDYKLAFEINGVYWHGELSGRDRLYHITKTNKCNDAGVRLVHILDNEWIQQSEIVKSRISSFLGLNDKIFARKCSVVSLSNQQSNTFFDSSHIQGSVNASICYGLEYQGDLVAAMSFGNSRFNKGVEYELLRYSNKLNTNVIGGASKLFQHFIRQHNPISVISYSDKRWNTGRLYHQLGFAYSHSSTPNYFYFKRSNSAKLYSRQNFQKHKLKTKLESFDPVLTEWENMVNNGYDRIWDCGNSVWIWNKLS